MIQIGAAALLLVCLAPAAMAQVAPADYVGLELELDGRIQFETLPHRAEPGHNLNAPLRVRGAWLGERFAGQVVTGAPHDLVLGRPTRPLTVKSGAPGQNLSVAYHAGFGSNALFPLGPDGFPGLSARGEGAVAILFDRDQAALGLLVHSDYADPLGARPPAGEILLELYSRRGALIAVDRRQLGTGIVPIALRRTGNIPDIAGVVITNTDAGGIAIDEILFQLTALMN